MFEQAAAIDPRTGEPGIAAGQGGLSGPAVRPIAVAQVRAVASAVGVFCSALFRNLRSINVDDLGSLKG